MTYSDDILEIIPEGQKETPILVKVLAILSLVGNGIVLLIYLIGFGFILLGNGFSRAGSQPAGMSEYGMFGLGLLVMAAFCVPCVIGVIKMFKGKKNGFLPYVIANSIWVLFVFFGFRGELIFILLGGGSIAFIVLFATQRKNLN